ncbi:aldo/keto reductase [Amnibacterium flavum]|uniref:Pyridoxal 4-dehydrogenase n=1 Tax=Amnibacterium flavum TaxID=2173173 RepID=A0A2V1HL50_9MICO|nr:aldo/keto reductase [Amnibacterium flavum]PVZ93353.1 pyridoxal 4-dehydrogenase [Amnibacterium flavum]
MSELSTAAALPSLGLGTAALGGMYTAVSSTEVQDLFDAAYARGIRYIDTAPMYGLTTAERRVGSFLDRAGRDSVQVSTKVGRLMTPLSLPSVRGWRDEFGWGNAGAFAQVYDYSYDGIWRSIEDSLQRLGRDRVDVVFIHDIGVQTHGDGNLEYVDQLRSGGYRAVAEIKAEGIAGAIGLGVNEGRAVLETLDDTDLDWCLLANQFNLLEQDRSADVFERCAERGVKLLAAGVLATGVLAGGDRFRYAELPDEIATKLDGLRSVVDRFGVPLPAVALQFVERSGRFDTLLLGPRSAAELEQLLDWREVAVPDELWDELARTGLVEAQWLSPEGARR